jgi:serine/threonine-protein kinase
MPKTFTITTTATDTLKANDKGHAEAVFTVTNTGVRPVRGMARAKALDSTKKEWLQISGDSERDFTPGSTQQVIVTFDAPVPAAAPSAPKPPASPAAGTAPPVTAAADKYSFRLDVASATNPDEDFTEGPVVRVELPTPKPVTPKKPFPKWIFIPIAAVLLIAIGIGIFVAIPKKVSVPNVIGMTVDNAKSTLAGAKLTPVEKEVQITEKAPPGQVIDQDPKAESAPVPKGTQVQLTIEGEVPLVEVPDVTKRLITDARERIKEKGLSAVEKSTEVIPGLQPDQVVSQNPVGGTQVKPGSTIELVVAAERQIPVPDVVFKPIALAEQLITAAGLKFVEKQPELADGNFAPGNVKRQNPAAQTKVPPGSTVELVAAARPTTVPDVKGKRIAEAQALLQSKSLELGRVSGVDQNTVTIALINFQNPAANSVVAVGTKVDVSVPSRVTCLILPCLKVSTMDLDNIRRLDPSIKQPLIRRP